MMKAVSNAPEGYPSVATFLDSDENFMLYRRFGYLQARLLLDKQDDLRQLEAKLDRFDKQIANGESPENLTTRDLEPEDAQTRKKLMNEIESRFCEYGLHPTPLHAKNTFLPFLSDFNERCTAACCSEPPCRIRIQERG
jgi:hypothetical protein